MTESVMATADTFYAGFVVNVCYTSYISLCYQNARELLKAMFEAPNY